MTDSLCVKNEFHQEWEKTPTETNKEAAFLQQCPISSLHYLVFAFLEFDIGETDQPKGGVLFILCKFKKNLLKPNVED